MFVATRSSKLKSNNGENCETVVYEHKKLKKDSSTANDHYKKVDNPRNQKPKKGRDNKWTMKKLRYDIIKFGSTGFRGAKKEESKIALAVSLGAEPLKNKCINYKELLKIKQSEKIENEKLRETNKNKSYKKSKFKSNRKDKNGTKQLLDVYGKVRKT